MYDDLDERLQLESLLGFPLLGALNGRRARRFGLGMEIPSGPLAFRSRHEPLPLTDTEQSLLVAAGTGVSGWAFGVPFGPRTPESHAEFTVRFTGRTAPTAAGIGTPILFYTDDDGCYAVRTRDLTPEAMSGEASGGVQRMLDACRSSTLKIGDTRIDIPSEPPHILPPNLWWANRPGSTLFFPVGDASEEFLGILGLMMRHGVTVFDEDTGEPAGELEPFLRSGLLDAQKRFPLAELITDVNDSMCLELAFIGHNIVLMLQAMGLGGLYFNGMDGLSALGAYAADGVKGLGFRSITDDRWLTPNVVGLDGVYESLCPPYHPDMRSAVQTFVARKFGPGGAYDPSLPGPWGDPSRVRESVSPYSDEFVECMAVIAQYVYDKFGKFPGTRSTIMLPGFVQAHHIDTEFYDLHYQEGAYLTTHAEHLERWH